MGSNPAAPTKFLGFGTKQGGTRTCNHSSEARRSCAQRRLEHLLGAGRKRDLVQGDLVPRADFAPDQFANGLRRYAEVLEDMSREPFFLTHESEQSRDWSATCG